MSDYAIVSEGIVENIIVWDGESDYRPPENTILALIPDGAFVSIGWLAVHATDGSWSFEKPAG